MPARERSQSALRSFVTDPPYADAISYHEITEYFIAWLRKNRPEARLGLGQPPGAWLSKGSDEDFRREMVEAYRAMTKHMPDNGLQIVMFTHQDASVWADMARSSGARVCRSRRPGTSPPRPRQS